jgi:lysophospholipase L1-like esterase
MEVPTMKRKLWMAVVTLLGVIVMGELGCRLVWSVADLQLNPTENAHLRDHPTRLWVQAPNLDIELAQHGRLRTNALGLRNEEVIVPKPNGEFRVLSLGESSTWGHGVRLPETYSKIVEQQLKESGKAATVINAGIPAYTIQQSAIYLQEAGLRLQPDVVVVYHQTNDFLPAHVTDAHNPLVQLTGNDRELIERRRPIAGLLTFLFNSRLYLALRTAMLRLPSSLPNADTVRDGPVRVPPSDRRAALDMMLDECNQAGVRLVIVQPLYAIDHSEDRLLRDWSAERHVTYIETDALKRSLGANIQRLYLPDGVHPRTAVHRMLGEHIARSL